MDVTQVSTLRIAHFQSRHTDTEREFAYDRQSHIGTLDKA